MKVTSVELHPADSANVAILSFRDPKRLNPYNIKGIVGLDAEEIVPRYYGVSGSSASKFYSLSSEKRELVVRIELNPNFTTNESYSDLRDKLYKLIASSRTGIVQLRFKNGATTIAAISGFVTKFEASHFAKTPEAQLTIKCEEPMLKALTPTAVNVATLNPASTTITDTLSTAPHGFTFDMEVLSNVASFTIRGPVALDWTFVVTPVGGFLDNDILHFSSEYNKKELYLTRGANVIQLSDVITPGSVWPIMFPGANVFVCLNDTAFDWTAISYYPTYWGV